MTQKDVANLLNYSSQTISLWEVGKIDPKLDSVCAFTNALKIDFGKFMAGEVVDNETPYTYDNHKLLRYLKPLVEKMNMEKAELENTLSVSRPTLRKLISGEVVLSVFQYLRLCEKLILSPDEPFTETKKEATDEKTEPEKKEKHRWIPAILSIVSAAMVLSICIPVGLYLTSKKESISNNSKESNFGFHPNVSTSTSGSLSNHEDNEEIEVQIDNYQRAFVGFEINQEYIIAGESYLMEENYLPIKKEWYNKYIKIEQVKKNLSKTYYVNPFKFENYFDYDSAPLSLPFNTMDENLEKKIQIYNNSVAKDEDEKSFQLTHSEIIQLKDTINYSIPLLNDSCFHQSLLTDKNTISNSYRVLDYVKLVDSQTQENYILIEGVNEYNKNITDLYIPKSIEGIEDIRIDSYAFQYDKNPRLTKIAFEQKPHYIGDFAFEGLGLDILDFGYEDDLSYKTEVKYQYKQIQVEGHKSEIPYSNALSGIQHIDKARFPLELDTPFSYLSFTSLMGEEDPIDIDIKKYRGISTFVLPTCKNGTYDYNGIRVYNLRVNSLYIPNGITFLPKYDTKDLFLKLVRFEKGYSSLTSEGVEYLGNQFISFRRCFALEYYLRDIKGIFDVPTYYFKGNFYLRGVLPFENIRKLGPKCFYNARLPRIIHLKNVTKIATGSFQETYGLQEVHIYKSDAVSSENKLTIAEDAFMNRQSDDGIKKIVFHGFKDEEIQLSESYKSENIQTEFLA